MEVDLPEVISFPDEEERVASYWKKIDAFRRSNELSKDRPVFSFYDGPPFATGLPHYGHLLAGTIKDTVTRYAYQTGHHVERRFGWDCHGLPVEFEIEQKLGIKTKEDVLALGIDKYNASCREIVMRFAKEWETIVVRLGRWIDFEDDYKTLNTSYMESVWWVFKQLYEKDLVYRGFKVMPYSTGCTTPLSNFEAKLNYKDVQDPAVTVSFPLKSDPTVSLLAWTTTPWTLPSNLMLCVNEDMDYLQIEDEASHNKYILAEARLEQLYKNPAKAKFKVIQKYKGRDLVGWQYEPLFPYFVADFGARCFRVVSDPYVKSDSGTGIVHQAPAFGEDDYRVCVRTGAVDKTHIPCPVDDSGRFVEPITDFKGQHVKEADKHIVKRLKQEHRVVRDERFNHSYPFCWRSDTPLIYKAVPSWFIKAEELKDRLLANNLQSTWVPEFVQLNRFGNWLEDVRDWNVSRSRYWGTPLPIWMDEEDTERVVIGSVRELEELTGATGVEDIHRDHIDQLCIKSQKSGKNLKRVEEVFDCWFESGSMPYASIHYPFTEKARSYFEEAFPAAFVAEGLDQTRGWFYTLLVLSTALFDKPAFKHCVVNGLVLAEDGKKMSKRLKNYPDPSKVIHAYGADALRLYLVNSPAVRAEPLRFRESGVRDVIKDVMLPWFNAYRFLMQNARQLESTTGQPLRIQPLSAVVDTNHVTKARNQMDHWIMSSLGNLIRFVRQEMDAYRLYTVVPRLLGFIEALTNWYVRLNRPRLKGTVSVDDWRVALENLADVLVSLSRLMAPFAPFFSEYTYQHLKTFAPEELQAESVHFLMMPELRDDVVDTSFETAVAHMQEAITLGRVARVRRNVSVKRPLRKVTVVHRDQGVLDNVKSLENYVRSELNVRTVEYSRSEDDFLILKADADGRVLGKKLGKDFAAVHKAVRALSSQDVHRLQNEGSLEIQGHVIEAADVKISRELSPAVEDQKDTLEVASSGGESGLLIVLDLTVDAELEADGLSREAVNRIQKLRKKAKLEPEDAIEVFFSTTDETLAQVLSTKAADIGKTLRSPPIVEIEHLRSDHSVLARAQTNIGDSDLEVCIARASLAPSTGRLAEAASASPATVGNVATYLKSRSPEAIGLLADQLKTLRVDGIDFEIRLGYNVFPSEADRLAAGAPP